MTKTLIVGGGLIGMLTARELAEAGEDVAVLEKGTTGRESSWAGGGILSPLYPWRYPEPVTALARWSQSRYPALCVELAAETGIDPEWTPNGMLMVDVAAAERRKALGWTRTWGYRMDVLDAAGLRSCEPALGEGEDGLWMAEVAQVRNPRLLKALRASLDRRGVAVREGVAVEGFALEGDRIAGVRVGEQTLRAERVVVAGGAWTGELLGPTGLSLPVEPVRGQMILFNGPPGLVRRIVLSRERYLIPRRDGRVLAGSTLEHAGFEKVTTEAALAELKAAALRIVPALASARVETQWAGLRPGSPTGVPFIGEHPDIAGLFINAGHFRNGVVMGLASASLLGDLILDRGPDLDPMPYRPGAPRRVPEGGIDPV